jgi:hypothetical protein
MSSNPGLKVYTMPYDSASDSIPNTKIVAILGNSGYTLDKALGILIK